MSSGSAVEPQNRIRKAQPQPRLGHFFFEKMVLLGVRILHGLHDDY